METFIDHLRSINRIVVLVDLDPPSRDLQVPGYVGADPHGECGGHSPEIVDHNVSAVAPLIPNADFGVANNLLRLHERKEIEYNTLEGSSTRRGSKPELLAVHKAPEERLQI